MKKVLYNQQALANLTKKGKIKKSINAQNIVNAFAYMNLRNITTKRTNVF